jgi:thiol-disulfide isomerase/thioredoxin
VNYFRPIFLVLFLFFSPLAWAMGNLSTQAVENPLVGKAAPDAVLTKTDGTTASVIGSRQGKKAIVVFWATWCPDCYEELGTINGSFASVEQKGIKIILVDVGETNQVVKNYFNRRQMQLVSFVDEDSFLQETYRLVGIPTLIFIDEKGIIRSVTHVFPSDYENYFK